MYCEHLKAVDKTITKVLKNAYEILAFCFVNVQISIASIHSLSPPPIV